jgi:hypothetical protein
MNGRPFTGIRAFGNARVWGINRVPKPPHKMATGSKRLASVRRDDLRALEIEAKAYFAQAPFAHGMP